MRHLAGILLIAAACLTLSAGAGARLNAADARSRASFNTGWLFSRFGPMPDASVKPEPGGLEKPDLDDAGWRRLDLPHDWGIEGPFRMDLPGHTGKLPWAGTGWYRKHFTVGAQEKGRHFFVDFDGAMSHTKVWLNGQYLGEWPYGYASFRLDMTPYIRPGAENVLAVRLENPPNSSRWYPGGGIYRNVWIVKTGPVHIAHWGSFVTTPSVAKEHASVRIITEIQNRSGRETEVTVASRITRRGDSRVVASTPGRDLRIPDGGSAAADAETMIGSPELWSLKSPNLYTVITIVKQQGRLVDSLQTQFGIRSARFTADSGFTLNGERVRLNGVCNHHDLGLLGTAVNVRALERQIRLLQEMGANAIRTSHNPPAPELLELCDRLGMLVLDEAFDCWEAGKTPNDYSTLFKEWHERDIRALVRRDRNHPSVIAWSSGNEIREQGDGAIARKLTEIFHSEDPTRPVTAACDNPKAGSSGFQQAVDVFGYNYKPHLYGEFRKANPSLPLYGSETASCVSSYGEYVFPVSEEKLEGKQGFHVSSYDLYAPPWATKPDVEFEAQDRNPFVAGEFVWTGFDYLGEPTPFGEDGTPPRSSYFGIMDLCGFKKDRFYLYQARWRPELPMAHILPHWNWPERAGKVTPVHVYTSGDEAELFLNGASLGRKKKEDYQYRLRWDSVSYAPGELRAVAYRNGAVWAADTVRTTGQGAKVVLSADRKAVSADGRDLVYITAKVVDARGMTVPTSSALVRFAVSGPGLIAAAGNGDPTDHTSFQSERQKAFHGQCLCIIRSAEGKKGSIHLSASSEGLTGDEIVIEAK